MKESICIISPSLSMGGIERALVVFANYFVGTGYEVYYISCLAHRHFYTIDKRIYLLEPKFKYSGGRLNKLVYYPKIIFFIRRTVMRIQPDVVLVFGDLFNPLVLLALFGTKFPVFISDRTSPDFKLKFPILQLKKWLYPKSAGFIAQTKRVAIINREKFGEKLNIRIIPNALKDVNLFPEIMRENIILYVGRFDWVKGPERLIRAFRAIVEKHNWELHMVGEGPQLISMKKLVIELKISNAVVFYGNSTDVDRLFAKAGIYVLPSLYEGFPNSLCEAMAAGLPCICFDSIPHEEIFTCGIDGIAIREGDIGSLSASLINLIEDKKLREQIGVKAMEIRNRLCVELIGKQMINFMFER